MRKIFYRKSGVPDEACECEEFFRKWSSGRNALVFGEMPDLGEYWSYEANGPWISLKDFIPNPFRDFNAADDLGFKSDSCITDVIAIAHGERISGLAETVNVLRRAALMLGSAPEDLSAEPNRYWSATSERWEPLENLHQLRIKVTKCAADIKESRGGRWLVIIREGCPVWTGPSSLIRDTLKSGNLIDDDVVLFSASKPPMTLSDYLKVHPCWETWDSVPAPWGSGWRHHRATTTQRSTIAGFGLAMPPALTKGQASDWIDKLFNSPEANEARRRIMAAEHHEEFVKQVRQMEESGRGCEGHRTPSGALREEMVRWPLENPEADTAELKRAILELSDERIAYWMCLFVKDDEKAYEQATENLSQDIAFMDMHLWEVLRRNAADLNWLPSREKVRRALEYLDSKSVSWDDDNPEAFFEVMEKLREGRFL